jgi:hypothetical protein
MEADLTKRLLYPIYWSGNSYTLWRGTWFMETDKGKITPLPHIFATQLEWHWQNKCACSTLSPLCPHSLLTFAGQSSGEQR